MCEWGGRSLPSANPDNVAAVGATDARCGEGESWEMSFFPLCIRRGFDEKIPHVAVQNNMKIYILFIAGVVFKL